MRKVRWGIVSTAAIGMKAVIPGIMKSEHSEVAALASRDLGRAEAAIAAMSGALQRTLAELEPYLPPRTNLKHAS